MRDAVLCTGLLLDTLMGCAQPIDTVLFTEVGRYQHGYVVFPDSFSATTFASRIDRQGGPYLFMACGDSGLITLDISSPATPVVADRKTTGDLGGSAATNLEQEGSLLYVSLGAFQGIGNNAGLAILDISDPSAPLVLDVWDSSGTFLHGSAIVKVKDDLALLGAMEDGILVFDVGDPSDIQFVSSYQPDPAWPGIAGYDPQARGMAIANDVLYLAYDAGGLRAIDISDPAAPAPIGQYVNPDLPAFTPPAYNNVVVIGDRAYVTVDYCGLEVIDVGDPSNMAQVEWLNPWSCFGLSWVGSDGHTNELLGTMGDSLLVVSGGDSEVLAFDITDPDLPLLKGGVIQANDSAVAWGVDAFNGRVVASFINNHGALGLQPYDAKYGGVVLYDAVVEFSVAMGEAQLPALEHFPDPTTGELTLVTPAELAGARATVRDMTGRPCAVVDLEVPLTHIDLSGLAHGTYLLTVADTPRTVAPTRVIRQ